MLVKSWDEVGDEERGGVIEGRGEWMEEGGWKRKGEEMRGGKNKGRYNLPQSYARNHACPWAKVRDMGSAIWIS